MCFGGRLLCGGSPHGSTQGRWSRAFRLLAPPACIQPVRTPAPVAWHLCADRPVSGTYTSAQKWHVRWECRLSAKPLSPEAGPGDTFTQSTRVPCPRPLPAQHWAPSAFSNSPADGERAPPCVPRPPPAPRVLLWRPGPLCFCESAVPSVMVFCGAACLSVLPQQGDGRVPCTLSGRDEESLSI